MRGFVHVVFLWLRFAMEPVFMRFCSQSCLYPTRFLQYVQELFTGFQLVLASAPPITGEAECQYYCLKKYFPFLKRMLRVEVIVLIGLPLKFVTELTASKMRSIPI